MSGPVKKEEGNRGSQEESGEKKPRKKAKGNSNLQSQEEEEGRKTPAIYLAPTEGRMMCQALCLCSLTAK